jgi:hypothetical protein
MLIQRIYSVTMKTLCVNLKGNPETIKIPAERVEDDQNEYILKAFNDKNEKIASFDLNEIAGWWVAD